MEPPANSSEAAGRTRRTVLKLIRNDVGCNFHLQRDALQHASRGLSSLRLLPTRGRFLCPLEEKALVTQCFSKPDKNSWSLRWTTAKRKRKRERERERERELWIFFKRRSAASVSSPLLSLSLSFCSFTSSSPLAVSRFKSQRFMNFSFFRRPPTPVTPASYTDCRRVFFFLQRVNVILTPRADHNERPNRIYTIVGFRVMESTRLQSRRVYSSLQSWSCMI